LFDPEIKSGSFVGNNQWKKYNIKNEDKDETCGADCRVVLEDPVSQEKQTCDNKQGNDNKCIFPFKMHGYYII
jgi:hypothetical protein